MSKKTKVVKAEERKTVTEEPKVEKLTCNEFVGNYLIKKPEATEDELVEALSDAGIRKSQTVIDAWMADWGWMLPAFDAAGWKRPTV